METNARKSRPGRLRRGWRRIDLEAHFLAATLWITAPGLVMVLGPACGDVWDTGGGRTVQRGAGTREGAKTATGARTAGTRTLRIGTRGAELTANPTVLGGSAVLRGAEGDSVEWEIPDDVGKVDIRLYVKTGEDREKRLELRGIRIAPGTNTVRIGIEVEEPRGTFMGNALSAIGLERYAGDFAATGATVTEVRYEKDEGR